MGSEEPVGRQSGEKGVRASRTEPQPDQRPGPAGPNCVSAAQMVAIEQMWLLLN